MGSALRIRLPFMRSFSNRLIDLHFPWLCAAYLAIPLAASFNQIKVILRRCEIAGVCSLSVD